MRLFIIALLILNLGCTSENTSTDNTNTKSYEAILKEKEASQQEKEESEPGEPISTIEFALKAEGEDLKIFNDGIIPWISLENPSAEIKKLMDPDELVLPYNTATVIIDYPLNKVDSLVLVTKQKGFTRRELIEKISQRYHQIYKEEEATATTKTIPMDQRKQLINRNETNGKYGIWGHDLADLDLSEIEVYRTSDNKIILILSIES